MGCRPPDRGAVPGTVMSKSGSTSEAFSFSSSRLAYYLQKKGGETLLFIGGVNRRSKDIFRERIARYINDDPLLSEQILRSNTNRSKTVLMLKDYNPSKETNTLN